MKPEHLDLDINRSYEHLLESRWSLNITIPKDKEESYIKFVQKQLPLYTITIYYI